MKVFCHASNTTCLSYLKKHHNQFREKYVHMSKLDLLMRHLPIYAYRGLRLRAFWFLPPTSPLPSRIQCFVKQSGHKNYGHYHKR